MPLPHPPDYTLPPSDPLTDIIRLEETCGGLRQDLEARSREVEQLTTLSLRGDATVQEYMANLKVRLLCAGMNADEDIKLLYHTPLFHCLCLLSLLLALLLPHPTFLCNFLLQAMASEIRAAEMRMQDLVSELTRLEEELNRTRLERDDLRRVVGGLDAERDSLQVWAGKGDTGSHDMSGCNLLFLSKVLDWNAKTTHPFHQAELDHKTEQVAAMGNELEIKTKQLGETTRWGAGNSDS